MKLLVIDSSFKGQEYIPETNVIIGNAEVGMGTTLSNTAKENQSAGLFDTLKKFFSTILPTKNNEPVIEQKDNLKDEIENKLEQAKYEGRMEAVQEILQTSGQTQNKGRVPLPKEIGQLLSDSLKKNEQLAESIKNAEKNKMSYGVEMYKRGHDDSRQKIKDLQSDVADLIRDYAKGSKDVQSYYAQPRNSRIFLSPIEQERQKQLNLNSPKQQEEQKMNIAEKEEQKQNQQESRGWGRR